MKPLIVICGPTASGKTELSLEIAEKLQTEIISSDSRQIYKYLNIGTAKPTNEELSQVTHHFIDILEPNENYSSGKFAQDAQIVINRLYLQNKIPVIVGGSGLYIQALCEGFSSNEESKELLLNRNKLNQRIKIEGIESLYIQLMRVDLDAANKYNDKNPRRIIRALEYFLTFNKKFSLSHFEIDKNYKIYYIQNSIERDILYKRINLRSELMWQNGIVEETENLLKKGYSKELNSLNTIGYKEVIAYLENNLTKFDAIEKTKQFTRNYAKRQLTWFKKNENINYFQFQSKHEIKIIFDKVKKFFDN